MLVFYLLLFFINEYIFLVNSFASFPAIPNALRAIVMDKSSRFSKNCPDNRRAAFGIANARLQKNNNSTPTFGIAASFLK